MCAIIPSCMIGSAGADGNWIAVMPLQAADIFRCHSLSYSQGLPSPPHQKSISVSGSVVMIVQPTTFSPASYCAKEWQQAIWTHSCFMHLRHVDQA